MMEDIGNGLRRTQRGMEQPFGGGFGWAPLWTHPAKLLPGKSTGGIVPPITGPRRSRAQAR